MTDRGRRSLLAWLTEMLSTPRNEYPSFPAALSFATILGPPGALAALERRAKSLGDIEAARKAELARYAKTLPRVTLLELEYQLAVTAAELS